MSNELRIKPLLQYKVYLRDDVNSTDEFTAESYEVLDCERVIFYRTGNKIREYLNGVVLKIIVTPVDEA